MVTQIDKVVGATGHYLTWALAEADVTLGLVAADEQWRLFGQNQEFYVAGGVVVVGGQTTDATRNIVLDAEPGASFVDLSGNPLRYDGSQGCALRSGNFASTVFISTPYTTVRRLQIQASIYDTAIPATGAHVTIDQCILQGGGRVVSLEGGGTSKCTSTAFIRSAAGGGHGTFFAYGTALVLGCAIVRPSNLTPGDVGIRNEGGTLTVIGTFVGGFGTFQTGGVTGSDYNVTDLAVATGGAHDQTSVTLADQFEDASAASGTLDLRTKAGSAQIGGGTDLSAYGVTVDIFGTARASPFDAGVMQTMSSAAATAYPGAGSIVLAGGAVTAAAAATASPGAAALVLTGAAVAATAGAVAAPGPASLVLAGQAVVASAGALASPGAGAIVFAGQAVAASAGASAAPGPGTITLAGGAVVASAGAFVTIGPGTLTWQGRAPAVSGGGGLPLEWIPQLAGTARIVSPGGAAVLRARRQGNTLTAPGGAVLRGPTTPGRSDT